MELTKVNDRLVREMKERKAAERENAAKDEFLAMLGHELRNPLSAISSAASLLNLPAITPEASARARDIVQRQTRQLSSIVDDLLDLSRAMSGKIVLARQTLDLAAVVGACIDTFTSTSRLSGHRVTHAMARCWVEGDPTRLEQVTSNLIDNAVKYTPAGGQIHIDVKPAGDDVLLSIADSGVGIGADLLPHVFDLFVQASTSLDRSRGGLGIGLSLVRRLVELHGGNVAVDSPGPGLGSTFTVRLRRTQPIEQVPAQRVDDVVAHHGCILLVDDNQDGREMLALALDARGYSVHQAECGQRGIDLAVARSPHVAIVDIGLPGIDGYEVARRLRDNPATRAMRLIALTGYGLPKDQEKALQAGFDLHLRKPVDIDRLVHFLGEGSA